MENDNISNVWCYHPEEKADFEKDLTLKNEIKISLAGLNAGSIYNIFTYHGDIDYMVSRSTKLFNEKGDVEEEIDDFSPIGNSKIVEPTEYAVVMLEKVEWDSGEKKLERTDTLYIYCPVTGEPPEPDRFEGIYTQLKDEGVIQ